VLYGSRDTKLPAADATRGGVLDTSRAQATRGAIRAALTRNGLRQVTLYSEVTAKLSRADILGSLLKIDSNASKAPEG
jgi:hypothetical protein